MLFGVLIYLITIPTEQASASSNYVYDSDSRTLTIYNNRGFDDWKSESSHLIDRVRNLVVEPGADTVPFGFFNRSYEGLRTATFNGKICILGENFFGDEGNFLETVVFNLDVQLCGAVFCVCPELNYVEFNGKVIAGIDNPSPCEDMGCMAFYDVWLGDIVFNDNVYLSGAAFQNVKSNKVTFKGESYLSQGAFSFNDRLETIDFEKPTHFYDGAPFTSRYYNSEEGYWKGNENNALENLYFPDGSTFENCPGIFTLYTNLKYLEFEGPVELQEGSFTGCPNLTEIKFDSTSTLNNGCLSYAMFPGQKLTVFPRI